MTSIILITGANSGIGYATTKVLADASPNNHVIMTSRRIEAVNAALNEISTAVVKGQLSALQLDVTDEASIQAAVKEVEKPFGKLDVLVNNAGVGNIYATHGNASLKQQMDFVQAVNSTGPAIVSEAFKALLLKSDNPRSVFVSSGLASIATVINPNHRHYYSPYTMYNMSKVALNMWTIGQRKEWSKEGIKVYTIDPGYVKSNLRGKGGEEIPGWGPADDPAVTGKFILDVMDGKRDADIDRFIHKDGVWEW